MKKIVYLLVLSLTAGSWLRGQDVVVEKDPAVDTLIPRWGPNYRHYIHFFLGIGAAVDPGSTGATIRQPHFVDDFQFGLRYKLKLANFLAVGTELAYSFNNFVLKQDSSKTLPVSTLFDRQRMTFHNAQLGLYLRINYGKRGNSLGNYIDLGAYGEYVIRHVFITRMKNADNTITRSKTRGMDYYNPLNYGGMLRIGFGKWAFYGQYRVSDLFYPSKNLPELPRITAGIQLSR